MIDMWMIIVFRKCILHSFIITLCLEINKGNGMTSQLSMVIINVSSLILLHYPSKKFFNGMHS